MDTNFQVSGSCKYFATSKAVLSKLIAGAGYTHVRPSAMKPNMLKGATSLHDYCRGEAEEGGESQVRRSCETVLDKLPEPVMYLVTQLSRLTAREPRYFHGAAAGHIHDADLS